MRPSLQMDMIDHHDRLRAGPVSSDKPEQWRLVVPTTLPDGVAACIKRARDASEGTIRLVDTQGASRRPQTRWHFELRVEHGRVPRTEEPPEVHIPTQRFHMTSLTFNETPPDGRYVVGSPIADLASGL